MKNIKRVVNTSFWSDEKVLNDFTPEDKYFMLFLLTNEYSTQLGIYHLPIKKAALDLGYSIESVIALIDRFQHRHNIVMWSEDTSEIAIKNYLIHSVVKGGKPVLDCLLKEEADIVNKALLAYIYNNLIKKDIKNNTVLEYIEHLSIYKDIYIYNDNDNDNERIVDESWTNRKKSEKSSKTDDLLFDESKPHRVNFVSMVKERCFPIEIENIILEWLAYKSEKRQAYRETGFNNFLSQVKNNLDKYDTESIIEAFRQSMANNYQGVVWDKCKKKISNSTEGHKMSSFL